MITNDFKSDNQSLFHSTNKQFFTCIVTAGGSGIRFDKEKKKQFFIINDQPLINITIGIFYEIEDINEIIVTLPFDEYDTANHIISKGFPKKVKCIRGGETRQESVYKALQYCDIANKYVLIHDAVRPFLKKKDLQAMMEIAINNNAVIPGSKVKNTIKRVKADEVDVTIQRDDLIEVYTPQIFKYELIKKYHEMVKTIDFVFSDDASIFEYFGETVKWYEMDTYNIKITTKEDLYYAIWRLNNIKDL